MKKYPTRPAEPDINPALAVTIGIAVCLFAWAVVLTVVLGALVVAGTYGLLLLIVGVGVLLRGLL